MISQGYLSLTRVRNEAFFEKFLSSKFSYQFHTHIHTHTHSHTHTYIYISELSVLFHWSICLFLCQHHPVLITVTLRYSLKSENIMASTLALVFFWLGGVWLLLQSLFFVETSSSSFYNSVMVDFISLKI